MKHDVLCIRKSHCIFHLPAGQVSYPLPSTSEVECITQYFWIILKEFNSSLLDTLKDFINIFVAHKKVSVSCKTNMYKILTAVHSIQYEKNVYIFSYQGNKVVALKYSALSLSQDVLIVAKVDQIRLLLAKMQPCEGDFQVLNFSAFIKINVIFFLSRKVKYLSEAGTAMQVFFSSSLFDNEWYKIKQVNLCHLYCCTT